MAYGTLSGWRAYATALGDTAPSAAVDSVASAALERGSRYIRIRYVSLMDADVDTTDERIVEAAYIAAALELASPGFFLKTYTPSQAKVLTGVGSLKWTPVTGGASGSAAMQPVSPEIEALLQGLLWLPTAAMVV